jgi:ribosomal protein S18 acetylase RimI-like enzyme
MKSNLLPNNINGLCFFKSDKGEDIGSIKVSTHSKEGYIRDSSYSKIPSIDFFKSYVYNIHLSSFSIKEEFQGKGFGKYYLIKVLKELEVFPIKYITINVSSENLIALNLYKKLGFEKIDNNYEGYSGFDKNSLMLFKHNTL